MDPNDEVYSGQPLVGHGLAYLGAHLVQNSQWIKAIVQINGVHDRFDAAEWDRLRHYLFLFHDNQVECLAESAEVSTYGEPVESVVLRFADQLRVRK